MRISHLAFDVSDMEKSLDFYCNKLGFEKIFSINNEAGQPWIEYLKVCPGQFIELFYGGKEDAPKSNYSHLCLQVDDINEIETKMKSLGVTIDVPIKQGKDTNYQCWVRDPDGNRIEFMQLMPTSLQYKNC